MDKSDEKVKGIDRYLPTTRSKILLTAILPAGISTYIISSKEILKIFETWTNTEQLLLSVISGLTVSLFITLLLVLELAIICYQGKHSKTHHYTYHAPEMNAKWLISNASFRHYLFLMVIFILGLYLGKNT